MLDERSKELVGEGHRFDLLRNGKTIVRKGGYHLPSVDEGGGLGFYKQVLPIPEDQFISLVPGDGTESGISQELTCY